MRNKSIWLVLFICFNSTYGFCNRAPILIKVNTLMGERYVTKLSETNEIEEIFKLALDDKNYSVITSSGEALDKRIKVEDLLIMDVFVYQFPSNYPSMRVVISHRNEILHDDEEFIKYFADRITANQEIARNMAEKIPNSHLIMSNAGSRSIVFDKNRFSFNGWILNSMMEGFVKKHEIEFHCDCLKEDEFIYGATFEEFVKNLTNYTGFRNKLKGHFITLYLEIDEYGYTRLINKDIPIKLKVSQIKRINNVLLGIPLWRKSDTNKCLAELKLSVI